MKKKLLLLPLIFVMILTFIGCSSQSVDVEIPKNNNETNVIEVPDLQEIDEPDLDKEVLILEDGKYSTPDEVSLYIYTYDKLPSNYITKKEAMDLGWESSKGNLWDVTDGKVIGGDKFGNREGLLPKAEGRVYYEADVNYDGGFRGPERIVFSNDGLIFYTMDHYDSFEQLY